MEGDCKKISGFQKLREGRGEQTELQRFVGQ